MTAIAQQDKWILSQGRLESEGCAFMYSLQGSSYMITPRGDRLQLGRDRERMPLLHGRFTTPGMFVACTPDSREPDVVGLLIDTGATIHVAGHGWHEHLGLLPGVGMSARTVGGGVSASLGRGLLELDLRRAGPCPPWTRAAGGLLASGLGRPSQHWLPAADVGMFCGDLVEYVDEAPGLGECTFAPVGDGGDCLEPAGVGTVYRATGVRGSTHVAKDRRPCRFAPLNDHTVVASRLGFTDAAVLRAAPDFLVGVGALRVPAGYEPLDECFRLAAGRARGIRHRRDGESQGAVESCEIGERWYMDWTRMFESSHDGNKFGLVFVEAKTWLLRVRFFRDKSALSLVEGIAWLREFVRSNCPGPLVRELHGDSDTSWTVSGRGRDLNTAVVERYIRGITRRSASCAARPAPRA